MFQCSTITVAAHSGSNDVAERIAAIRNDKPGTCVSGLAFESACAGFEQGDTRNDSRFQIPKIKFQENHESIKTRNRLRVFFFLAFVIVLVSDFAIRNPWVA